MENASKALLIAASVLIVILLIAFGIRIFNSTSGSADQIDGTMKTTEIATFNRKFIAYVGDNKTRAQVISLLNVIIASNASTDHQVTVNNGSAQNKINALSSLDATYTIKIEDTGYINGYVSNIIITTSGGTAI